MLLYLNQEGRGIGLANKIRAYELQDQGFDTVEANERLGFKADQRDYGIGVQILRDLGVRTMRLLSNNPRKLVGLEGYGLSVSEWLPLEIPASDSTRRYLKTKKDKLGHKPVRRLTTSNPPPGLSPRRRGCRRILRSPTEASTESSRCPTCQEGNHERQGTRLFNRRGVGLDLFRPAGERAGRRRDRRCIADPSGAMLPGVTVTLSNPAGTIGGEPDGDDRRARGLSVPPPGARHLHVCRRSSRVSAPPLQENIIVNADAPPASI